MLNHPNNRKNTGLGRKDHSTHTAQKEKVFAVFFLRKMRLIRIHNMLNSRSQLLTGTEMLVSASTEPNL